MQFTLTQKKVSILVLAFLRRKSHMKQRVSSVCAITRIKLKKSCELISNRHVFISFSILRVKLVLQSASSLCDLALFVVKREFGTPTHRHTHTQSEQEGTLFLRPVLRKDFATSNGNSLSYAVKVFHLGSETGNKVMQSPTSCVSYALQTVESDRKAHCTRTTGVEKRA